ncbi:MAG TPA: TPM domain-containing protein [Candidatus Didemnitutus sp.]|nr:TPM domain-containing protein [Candidatus Didemnitutus sp.]
MYHRLFSARLDRKSIEDAIRRAEACTSGEICVIIHEKPVADAVSFAQGEFVRRGLDRTRHRNAVLFLVAPRSRTFAVIGDEGVHRRCGDPFWQEVAAAMAQDFRNGDFTMGLVNGITRAGDLLARHFPPDSENPNELPDQVTVV